MVRVAADKSETRSGWFSLIAAVGVALLAVAAFAIFRDTPPAAAPQRSLTEYPVRWTCELNAGHEFTAEGRFDPLPCQFPGCPGVCSIHQRYTCPRHGMFDAWVRFQRTEGSPGERVSDFRYSHNGPWRASAEGAVACPQPGCSADTAPQNSAWSEHELRQARTDKPPVL